MLAHVHAQEQMHNCDPDEGYLEAETVIDDHAEDGPSVRQEASLYLQAAAARTQGRRAKHRPC